MKALKILEQIETKVRKINFDQNSGYAAQNLNKTWYLMILTKFQICEKKEKENK